MRKIVFIFTAFLLQSVLSLFGQQSVEKEISKIREQYKFNITKKTDFIVESEHYNWEKDDLIPSLSEEELKHEYNEKGNFIADKMTYRNQNNEIQLIEIDDETNWYQEGKTRERHREYHFWEGELFFYFEHTSVSYLNDSFEGSTFENRIYIKDDQIIRWLGKESEGNPNMANIQNYAIETKTGYLHDYHLLDTYSLNPDW